MHKRLPGSGENYDSLGEKGYQFNYFVQMDLLLAPFTDKQG